MRGSSNLGAITSEKRCAMSPTRHMQESLWNGGTRWWFGKEFETGINRLQSHPRLRKYMEAGEILLLVGARRTGKSGTGLPDDNPFFGEM